jgi:hypothetical protein
LDKETLGQRLNDLGWQCGSVLPEQMYAEMRPLLSRPNEETVAMPVSADWLVVISQTCDVVAHMLNQEPHVEVVWCRAIDRPRAQFCDIKSTRRLDFRPDRQNHPEVVLTVHAAHDRYVLPRSILTNCRPRPDRRLAGMSIRRIQAWIALRYSRPAWPDQFVARLDPARGKLVQALEAVDSDDIAEVRIALSPHDIELNDREPYTVAVFFVVDEQVWESDPAKRQAIHASFGKFISALKGCGGIAVDENFSGVVSGAKFTWQQVQLTDQWNFANLTYRE